MKVCFLPMVAWCENKICKLLCELDSFCKKEERDLMLCQLVGKFVLRLPGEPCLVWLSGLSTGLQTKRSLVRFPVRAHAWVAGQGLSRGLVRDNHTLFLSLSFSLLFPPSKNKIIKSFLQKRIRGAVRKHRK